MLKKEPITVGIVGAGAIAMGVSALLEQSGVRTTIWSPSARLTSLKFKLQASGVVEGVFNPRVATNAEALALADYIVFCLPANGHRATMDRLAPSLSKDHVVIISSHASFGGNYIDKMLRAQGLQIPVIMWNTTPLTARQKDERTVHISSLRKSIEYSTTDPHDLLLAGEICRTLFANQFIEKRRAVETLLSNLNPLVHLAMAMCNITRIEGEEHWCQRRNVTPAVGRMIESLDRERVQLAYALGCKTKTIFEIYGDLAIPGATVSDINQRLAGDRAVMGPTDMATRYVTEDAPFGLAVISALGRHAGVPTPLHDAGLEILSGLYGRRFEDENDLLKEIDLRSI